MLREGKVAGVGRSGRNWCEQEAVTSSEEKFLVRIAEDSDNNGLWHGSVQEVELVGLAAGQREVGPVVDDFGPTANEAVIELRQVGLRPQQPVL